ncbi:BlaI/MecI/CopY family transcriptional regulator [Vallitalea sediminicola]
MEQNTQISGAEWKIMNILWSTSPLTANEIINHLGSQVNWNDRTIRTLINRLLKKKAISFDKSGREYLYYPMVNEDECKRQENMNFLNRVYNGTFSLMLAKFLEDETFSKDEIDDLKKILNKKTEK